MDPRPVFVLTTAKTCGACHRFKHETWDALRSELEKQKKVQIVTVELPDTNTPPDTTTYHKDFYRFLPWYPTMSLFPADRWFNHSSELIGIIKNGKIVPPGEVLDEKTGKMVHLPEHIDRVGNVDLSKEDILKWVDYTLANDKFFTRNPKSSSSNGNKQPAPQAKQQSTNTNKQQEKIQQERIRVPTAASYNKFQPSRVK